MKSALALDNSGTLSEPIVVRKTLSDLINLTGTELPNVPRSDGRVALVSLPKFTLDSLSSSDSLNEFVREHDSPQVVLSNEQVTREEARTSLMSAETLPTTLATELIRDVRDQINHEDDSDPQISLQCTVAIDEPAVLQVIARSCRPKSKATRVVGQLRQEGWEPYILSGDARPLVEMVGSTVGIPSENIFPLLSTREKGEAVRRLQREGSVVMVGDYLNDKDALAAADLGIRIDSSNEDVSQELEPVTDVEIEDLDGLSPALNGIQRRTH